MYDHVSSPGKKATRDMISCPSKSVNYYGIFIFSIPHHSNLTGDKDYVLQRKLCNCQNVLRVIYLIQVSMVSLFSEPLISFYAIHELRTHTKKK